MGVGDVDIREWCCMRVGEIIQNTKVVMNFDGKDERDEYRKGATT